MSCEIFCPLAGAQKKIWKKYIYEIFWAYLVRYVLFYSSVKSQVDLSYFKGVINFFGFYYIKYPLLWSSSKFDRMRRADLANKNLIFSAILWVGEIKLAQYIAPLSFCWNPRARGWAMSRKLKFSPVSKWVWWIWFESCMPLVLLTREGYKLERSQSR